MGEGGWTTRAGVALGLALTCAGLVAVWAYHGGRLAWTDEAWVIDYASAPTLGRVWREARGDRQPVPPGYLALIHAVGPPRPGGIWVYRLTSILAAGAMLVLAGRLIGGAAGHWGIGVAAALVLLLCPALQRYATEVKQYMLESALTLALLVTAQAWWASGRAAWGWGWLACALAALACTFAGWFAVAGSAAALVLAWGWRGDRRRAWLALGMSALLVAVALGLAWLVVRHLTENVALRDYWTGQYLPRGLALPGALWTFGTDLLSMAWYLYDLPVALLLVLALAGWVPWWRRQPLAAGAAAATAVATVLASAAGHWPTALRVNLHLLTLVHLGMLAGAASLLGLAGERGRKPPDAPGVRAGPVDSPAPRRPALLVTPPLACLALAAVIVHEARNNRFDVAQIEELLAQTGARLEPGQVVIMDPTTHLNHRFRPTVPASHRLIRVPWVAPRQTPAAYYNLLTEAGHAPALLAVGHHNRFMEELLPEVAATLAPSGHYEIVWSGRFVALYHFTPWSPGPAPATTTVARPTSESPAP